MLSPGLTLTRAPADRVLNCRRRLKNKERESYIAAVKCLQSKPSTAPLAAAQNRYDDFIATHQVQTESVHFTVRNFLTLRVEP